MEILNSGSFVPLDNREKIEQLIFTATTLASEVSRTEGFQSSGPTNHQLGLEMWKGAEYVCRAHEEATIRNLFLSKFLEKLREIERQTAVQPRPPQAPAVNPTTTQSPISEQAQVATSPSTSAVPISVASSQEVCDEYLGVISETLPTESDRPSYAAECVPEWEAACAETGSGSETDEIVATEVDESTEDQPQEFFQSDIPRAEDPELRLRTCHTLSWIHESMGDARFTQFKKHFREVPLSLRARVIASILSFRFRNSLIKILLVLNVMLISTIVATSPTRAILAALNMTTTQVTTFGFVEGGFHGVAGAVLWSVFIGLPILLWWYLVERKHPWKGRYTSFVGTLGGLIGGIVNTVILIQVFGNVSLSKIDWIPEEQSKSIETLTVTGMALAMPILGAAVGFGVGESARRLLAWWEARMNTTESASVGIVKMVCTEATYKSLWILIPMLMSAAILCLVLFYVFRQSFSVAKILGESLSIFFGGIGLLIGIFLGLHIVRNGLPSLEE